MNHIGNERAEKTIPSYNKVAQIVSLTCASSYPFES